MEAAVLNLLFWLVVLPIMFGGAYLAYFLLSLPLRRQERARLFVDLVGLGLARGQSAERTLTSVAASRDRALGVRLHLLAAHLESGLSLDQALARVPRLLPPAITAMLRVGRELGDLRKVLPACRQKLQDATTTVFAAHHYLVLVALAASPAWIVVFWTLCVFVLPRFSAIAEDMEMPLPGFLTFLAGHHVALIAAQAALMLLLYAVAAVYVGGPRLARWLDWLVPSLPDRIAFGIPWRRKRMQRDFSAILAVLLDAGMPEALALRLAAESTANAVFRRRASAAVADLERGVGLTEAVRHLDAAGEFRWRLENAARGPGRFVAALNGWHDALEAKAYQLEQTAAQLVTTGLVLVNGLFVGALAASVFSLLISITRSAALW